MALVQGLITFLTRKAGKIVNTVFSWATTLLFGKVPENRQIYISLASLGAVLWMIVVIGIAFPSAGTFLLSFVTLPEWLNDRMRWVMLGLAVVLPAVNGIISLFMLDPQQRPKDFRGKSRIILRGYPYTLGLSMTLAIMLISAPILKLRDMAHRWMTLHIPILVDAEDYRSVLTDVARILEAAGRRTVERRAPLILRVPSKILAFFAGSAVHRMMAEQMAVLHGDNFEILLHPSDLMIRAPAKQSARLHALMTEHLSFTRAHLTWDRGGNELEDRLRAIWLELDHLNGNSQRVLAELEQIDREMRSNEELPYEEWEVLFRQKLLIERKLYRVKAGMRDAFEDKLRSANGSKPLLDRGWVRKLSWVVAGGLFALRALQKRGESANGGRSGRLKVPSLGSLAAAALSRL